MFKNSELAEAKNRCTFLEQKVKSLTEENIGLKASVSVLQNTITCLKGDLEKEIDRLKIDSIYERIRHADSGEKLSIEERSFLKKKKEISL